MCGGLETRDELVVSEELADEALNVSFWEDDTEIVAREAEQPEHVCVEFVASVCVGFGGFEFVLDNGDLMLE